MAFPLLGKKLRTEDYCRIILGEENPDLDFEWTSDPLYLEEYISSTLERNQVEFGIGGYLEKRNIYQASENFSAERNIHLGVDVWGNAGTQIYAPLDGLVHSFKYNDLAFDYGGTIILRHESEHGIFHTLYGHLSLGSLEGLEKGKTIREGEVLAKLGDWDENGGWPPHLHFQIIREMQGFEGDYVGVCEERDLDFYRGNCPDATYLIGIENNLTNA